MQCVSIDICIAVTKSSLRYEEERNHFTPLYSQWYVDVQRRRTKVLQCPPGDGETSKQMSVHRFLQHSIMNYCFKVLHLQNPQVQP